MMTATQTARVTERGALAELVEAYSVEVTARDADAVVELLPPGAEVSVANLPNDGTELLVKAATRLRQAGLVPMPHIVARKIRDHGELDTLLAQLAGEAGVDRALALGGDRDHPAGAFSASLQLIETGAFERHGIRKISIACYPEGHGRIGPQALQAALVGKLAAAAARGIEARLMSQFVFEAGPIVSFARQLRAAGISAPLRVGVAGPARRTTLIKYAIRCGVGASLRALTERRHLMTGLLGGETPEQLLGDLALACQADPSLGIEGVHFFTFGAPGKAIEWAQGQME